MCDRMTVKPSVLLVLFLPLFLKPTAAQWDTNAVPGRTTIVHLFEWRWNDIADECERWLNPNGFAGVQVSPPNENLIITDPWRPWWERYQPISYKLCSRSGSEEEFKEMVKRCNNVGVRIYVDAILNHMCGAGVGPGTASTCGSSYDTNKESFPSVGYSNLDFNDAKCHSASGNIDSYQDKYQVRNCRLVSLLDISQDKDYVRDILAQYLNRLIDIGVAGFRLDAGKHMWPGDIQAITGRLKNLNTDFFPSGSRPFIYQEVIDQGGEAVSSSEYLGIGYVTEFKYSINIGTVIRKWSGQKMAYLRNWGEGWAFMPSTSALVFVDNHDNQRGSGAGGKAVLTFWDSRLYKVAVAFTLAHPYGKPRIMSSFHWNRYFVNDKDINDWQGPPSYSNGSTKAVTINSDLTCGNDWICEHRWRQIKNMVAFRNAAGSSDLRNWWDNGNNQVAFGRGNRGFIVFNNDDSVLDLAIQTGLAAGTYCDIISGDFMDGHCTAGSVLVGSDGMAHLHIESWAEDPMIAIHVNAKL
uniref:pancreatic alpha-amylase-like isoform X2 n=1 Tax=Myxine glutinosa TaxID=7769 RepID=UPI00358F875F